MTESLKETEFKLGNTTFQIKKLLPMESKKVFLTHVRPLLKGALSADTEEGSANWKLMLAAFTDAPQEHYDALVRIFYQHITYMHDGENTFLSLLGDEDNAFKDLDMSDIIELDVRAFIVNFQDSLFAIASKFQRLI